eukprot:499681-Pelagomonas_calceolata.AAC.1
MPVAPCLNYAKSPLPSFNSCYGTGEQVINGVTNFLTHSVNHAQKQPHITCHQEQQHFPKPGSVTGCCLPSLRSNFSSSE